MDQIISKKKDSDVREGDICWRKKKGEKQRLNMKRKVGLALLV